MNTDPEQPNKKPAPLKKDRLQWLLCFKFPTFLYFFNMLMQAREKLKKGHATQLEDLAKWIKNRIR